MIRSRARNMVTTTTVGIQTPLRRSTTTPARASAATRTPRARATGRFFGI
ncbi:hypothetical protein [Ornithinimicrobium kibberense]